MFKKLLIGAVMVMALMIEMPFSASAATSTNAIVSKPQIRIRIGRQHRRSSRWRHRRYNRVARYRVVPQYYWSNGRRYVRYVRVPVYYNN